MHLLKKAIIFAVIAGVLYFLLGYHYIVIDKSVKMLKKSEYNLKYTFFSTKGRSIESILSIQELWDDGIGELLVEEGEMSEEYLEMYKYNMEGEEDY
ncbi:MAG: hypothetical protein JW944_13220 [Deltaproteobacteria bacterium]|nr:hypothetical protein [Deltaproteobacteria bacterium]